MPISNWSTTAADNDDADAISGINWAENQLANTVNDSARAMMAVIKGDWVAAGLDTLPNAWTVYTPTQASTITTITGSITGRYKQTGKTVHVAISAQTTTGTGGGLVVSLPVVAAASGLSYSGSAIIVNTGVGGVALISSGGAYATVLRSDGGSVIAPGNIIAISITYEAA